MSDLPPNSPPPPPPPALPFQPPPGYLPLPPSYPPPGVPGQGAQPILPAALGVGGISLISQFSGSALWSIGLGIVSIAAPFFINTYFIFLPLIGFYYGVRAIRQGRMIGGVAGLVLNVLGGIVSLFMSRLIGG